MRARSASVVIWSLACLLPCSGLRSEVGDELIESVGRIETYESIRGDFSRTGPLGHSFSISPDEVWLVANRGTQTLLHLPSKRQWDLSAAGHAGLPATFSADGTRLYLDADSEAVLSPEMDEVRAQPSIERDLTRVGTGAFLDEENLALDRSGQRLSHWWQRGDVQGLDRGKWIRSAAALYEAAETRALPSSFLIVSPPGVRKGISYAPVHAYWRTYFARSTAEGSTGSPERNARLEALAQQSQRDFFTRPIRLGHLAISPDGRFLAAIEEERPWQGVLIPLDRGGLAAYPFAKNVYGRMLWSRDSRRLYFYSQPIAGNGNGTVHCLSLDPSAIPESLPELALTEAPERD